MLTISFFDHKRDNEPKLRQLSWEKFCAFAQSPEVRADKDGRLFSPAVFDPPRRAKANVQSLSMLALDYDHGADWERDCGIWRNLGLAFVAQSTHSSYRATESNPDAGERFRVVILLAEPVPAGEYPSLWKWAERQSGNRIDPAAKDSSRILYTPVKASNDAKYRYEIHEGAPLDWRALDLTVDESPTPAPVSINADKWATAALNAELARVVTTANGTRNDTLNKAAFALGQIVAGGALDQSSVADALQRAAIGAGLDGAEVKATIASGLAAGAKKPRSAPKTQHGKRNARVLEPVRDEAEISTGDREEPQQQQSDAREFKLADGRIVTAGFHNLDGALTWIKESGEVVKLANFAAQIIGDVAHDDGAEVTRHFEVEAKLIGECISKKGIVPAADFEPMRWLPSLLGARAFAWPGQKERASVAIRFLSRDIKERRVVAHTGWRQDGDGWRYYHAGGAIGAEGLIDAEVDLPNALAPFNLPKPPTAERLREMVRAVAFDLPRVAPDAITLPLIGAAFVSVLTAPDFSLFLFGYTGSGKSELAALLQSFFGAGFHAKNLPAAWSSSGNSLEAIAHTAADAVLVVDDFCPAGASADQARLHAAADRVLRAQGNHSGRGRCRADGTVKPAKPPRGLIVATGEDVPRGQSLRARLATIQIEKDSVNWAEITKCQAAARASIYADAMSAFLQWLAREKRIEKLRATMSDEIGKLRTVWNERAGDSHKRNATTLAQLQHAWAIWLEFAEECGALDSDECAGVREAVEIALDSLGGAQNAYQAGENPALRFVELIQAALTSGKAHLAAMDNGKPDDCESWGWRADGPENEFRPMGDRIGWIDGDNVYLNPDAAYTCAQKITANGEGLIVSSQTLWKRLKEAGLLASVDAARETQKVRRKIGEKTQTVIHLMCAIFSG